MTRIGSIAAMLALPLVLCAPVLAADKPAQPPCRPALETVKRDAAQSAISPEKREQVRALLDQVDRACDKNDEVVAMAGIDQVHAILAQEKKRPDEP